MESDRYNDPSQQPGSGAVIGSNQTNAATTEQFMHFWNELAGRFANNEKVIFGYVSFIIIRSNDSVLTQASSIMNEVGLDMYQTGRSGILTTRILTAPRHGHFTRRQERPGCHHRHPQLWC